MPELLGEYVIPKTRMFRIELSEYEIFNLVHKLKFQREEHNVLPDLSEPIWKALEKLIGTVERRNDSY